MAKNQDAFIEHATKAVDEHIKFQESVLCPGFVSFICDTDVYLGFYKFTLNGGIYLVREGEEINSALLYMITYDTDEFLKTLEGGEYEETTNENGSKVRAYKGDSEKLPIKIEPISVKLKGEVNIEEHYLTYLEYVAWLAINVATTDEERNEIFNAAYGVDAETEIKRGDDLPRQDVERPRKRNDPKTKISRLIGIPGNNEKLYTELGFPLKVGSSKNGNPVKQIVAIQYLGADGVVAEGREQLTQLDRQVHYAVISHYVAGNRVISLLQICELVYGHNKPTDEQRQAVEECLERQMWTKISINMEDEAAKHDLKHPELLTDYKIEGQMLTIRKVTARAANGRKIVAYQLMGEPLLYTHAQVTGQLLTYSPKLLQAPKGMKNTDKTMAVRQTILEELDRAKRGKRDRFMRYETIFKLSGQIPNGRTERNRQYKFVRGYLGVLVENGVIERWEERKEGSKLAGFEVFFPEKKESGNTRKRTHNAG